MSLLDLALVFLRAGAASFGGGTSALGGLRHDLVDHYPAMTARQFQDAYALGQATPGPGILYLIPMGFYAAGAPGAVVALVAFLAPPLVLQVVVASQWERLSRSPWIRALDRTLVPISIGLIAASFHALGTPLLSEPAAVAALVLAMSVSLVFRPTPALIVIAAGLLGLLGVI